MCDIKKKRLLKIFALLLCAAIVLLMVFCIASVASAAGASEYGVDFLDSIGFPGLSGLDSESISQIEGGVFSLALKLTGTDPDSVTAEYYEMYYDFLVNDWWGLATGAGGIYDSSGNFNEAYLKAMGDQFVMYNSTCPFSWDYFIKYVKVRRAAELAGSESFDSGSYVKSNPDNITISSKGLKNLVDYWSDYYKPKDNVDQYTYSYQSASTKLDKSKRYAFTPYAPVYTDDGGAKTGWGFKSWSGGVYMLPYLVDDDNNGGFPYYSDLYYFIHSKRSSDGVLQIVVESYKLSDNSLVSTVTKDWDTSRLSLGLFWNGGTNINLLGYKSYFDYMGNTSSTQVCAASPSRYLYSGNVGNLTKVDTVSFLANNVGYDTFTPDVNTHDDWGFLVSAKPFDLWINQTDIDVSKIPDDYKITINGDNINDYSITNTSGDTTTINNYVTNNYNIPSSGSSGGGNTGGSTSGNVTVGGNIDVSGKVDINVNVTGGSNTSISSPSSDDVDGIEDGQQSIDDLIKYYQGSANEIGSLFAAFLAVVPAPIRNMVPLAVGVIVFLGLVKALH